MSGDKVTQQTKMLNYLKQHGKATNRELNAIAFRYGAYIHELRKEGYIIVTSHVKEGLYEYVYQGNPELEVERKLKSIKKNPGQYNSNLLKRIIPWL